MSMVLRPLGPGEVAEAARTWLRARKAAAPAIPLPLHPDAQVLSFFAEQVVPSAEVHVAELDGSIVGVLALQDDWLAHLYVVPERTGQGTGSQLLRLAQELRPDGLQLWVFQANVPARRFYARHGFVEVQWTDGAGNVEGAPDVRMVWPGTRLPQPYSVVAVNLDPQADNRIHADDVAQSLGFAGALVPGVEVFALATAPLVQAWGEAFLGGGRVSTRFRKPVYDGERVTVSVDGADLAVTGPDGVVRATGSAFAPASKPAPSAYQDVPLPAQLADAPSVGPMGTVRMPADPAACADYVRRIGDACPLYAERVHPGLLLRLVNLALMSNVALGPWIHTASDARFLRPVRLDEDVEVRSRVTELFERRGHRYVRYDALVLAGGRPAVEVDHEAIWQLAPA